MKKRPNLLFMVFIVSILMLQACSSQSSNTGGENGESNNSENSSELRQISIAGAGTAGTFYVMASAFADLLSEEMGVSSIPEVTAGSVENNKLIGMKDVELAVSQLDVTQLAVDGAEGFENPVDVNAILPMYPNVVQVVTLKDSDINSFTDLKGKKVSVGSPGSGVLATNKLILEQFGMSLEDIEPEYLSFSETTTAFRDGSIDAAIVNTAAPAPFIVDLETSHPVKLVPFSDEEINRFTNNFTYFSKETIPSDAYNSLESDVNTFAVWVTLVGQKDLPEDAVYNIVKTIFENQESLKHVHAVAKYITLENVEKITGVPYHPGALRYFEENGIKVD